MRYPHWYKPLYHLKFTEDCGTMLGVTLTSAVGTWFRGREFARRNPGFPYRDGKWWRVKHFEVCFGRDERGVWVWKEIW